MEIKTIINPCHFSGDRFKCIVSEGFENNVPKNGSALPSLSDSGSCNIRRSIA